MTNPTLVTTPFAENGDKNTIPQSVGVEPQNATQEKGFPEITQTPISAGGIPPERKDFNGILNLYGQHIVHLEKGLPYEFDAAFATAIGGYPLHARIMLSNGDIVKNTIASNSVDPNSVLTNWVKINSTSQIFDGSGKSQNQINTETSVALTGKADKATTLSGYGINDAYTKAQVDSTVGAIANGSKSYQTLALAQAAATGGNIPANSSVYVTNDSTSSNNGLYTYNGTTLTKSVYDPVAIAAADATTKANAAQANANTFSTNLMNKADGNISFDQSLTLANLVNSGYRYRAWAYGSYTEKQTNVYLIASTSSKYSNMIQVANGARIFGTIYRYVNLNNIAFFNQKKEFVSFLDSVSTTVGIESIDLTCPSDGYVVIQQNSLTQPLSLTISSKTVLVNKDNRDSTNGYVSNEFAISNFVASDYKDITSLYKSLCDLGQTRYDGSLNQVTAANFTASKFVKCLPNVTFNLIKYYIGNLVTTSAFIFYDSSFNVVGSYVLNPQGESNQTLLRYGVVTSPANTAYMKTCYSQSFSGTWDDVVVNQSNLVINLKMDSAGREYYRYLTENSFSFDAFGDSLQQGISGSISSAVTDTYVLSSYASGGENVQDTLYRRSLNHVVAKTAGLVIPNDGTAVPCLGWFDFDEVFTFNTDGTYSVDAISNSEIFNANGNTRGEFSFSKNNQNFIFSMKNKTIKQVAPFSQNPITLLSDEVISINNPKLGKFAIVMMGTNGGFTRSGQSLSTTEAMDNLIDCFKRIYDQYSGKIIFCGYHYAPVPVRAYYREKMSEIFGEKFIDLPTFLMGRGRYILKIDSFNSPESNFMNTYQGVTSGGGNSFIPLFSSDNTHPRTIVYRAFSGEILRRAYQLGFMDKLYTPALNFPAGLSISGSNSITVGGNTVLTVSFTAGFVDASLFTWSSSNSSIASVSTENWVNSWSEQKYTTTTVTGLSAGTVTITCKARYGGAIATFDVTVS